MSSLPPEPPLPPPPPPAYWVPPPPPWTTAPPPRRRERWWLHVLLFVLTLATTTILGAFYAVNYRPALVSPRLGPPVALVHLLAGALTYSIPLMAILLAHEMGHYLACRRYGIDASPPYFIPFPPFLSISGTLGAFIRIREPFRDRRQLFDVGVAGPIAGFVVALPVVAYGILHTRANLEPIGEGTLVFHYPLAVAVLQELLIGHTFSSLVVVEHPSLMAGWFGLFVTALNLMPLGQLDGGHALHALFGRRTRWLRLPLFAVCVALGFRFPGWWVLAALVLVFGLRHPPVLDEETPVGRGRVAVALLVLLILVLCFVPVPLSEVESVPRRAPVKGDGPVVHELHLHPGAEDPRLHAQAVRPHPGDEAVEEGPGPLGARRPLEPGPPPA